MRSTGFYLARPTHDGVPRQAGRQGHGSDTSPTQIIGFARGPLSAHSLIHQPRQRPVFIPYPLDDGFVLREGMFLHITTAGNTYLIMLLFRCSLVPALWLTKRSSGVSPVMPTYPLPRGEPGQKSQAQNRLAQCFLKKVLLELPGDFPLAGVRGPEGRQRSF